MSKDIINLTNNSYWGKKDFLEDIERVRKLFVELLANSSEDYDGNIQEIGYCLTVFEIIKDMEIVDGRQKQEQKEKSE